MSEQLRALLPTPPDFQPHGQPRKPDAVAPGSRSSTQGSGDLVAGGLVASVMAVAPGATVMSTAPTHLAAQCLVLGEALWAG